MRTKWNKKTQDFRNIWAHILGTCTFEPFSSQLRAFSESSKRDKKNTKGGVKEEERNTSATICMAVDHEQGLPTL